MFGYLRCTDSACVLEPPHVEERAFIPDICSSLIVQPVQRYGKKSCPFSTVVSRAAGKRFNVLHRRIDSWHYEVDQLILGTLLFTLFTFTFPTLLTYGILFALVCDLLLWVLVADKHVCHR